MFRDLCNSVYQNKNLLMLFSVGFYILALFGVLSGHIIPLTIILTILFIFYIIKDYFPLKIIFIWVLTFILGIVNTNFRLRETDELLSLAPVNSEICGKIISIPQKKGDNKLKFFFKVNSIKYDNIVKTFDDEKVLVSMDLPDEKLKIYDSYKIRGRLSQPFKAGNPSQFDYGDYLRNFNTYAVFYGRNPYDMRDSNLPCYEKLEEKIAPTQKVLQWINNRRESILEIHSHYLKTPYLEILGGIVFGDDAVSPPENIKQSFVNSGLLHILAASGMNVAFIYSFFFFFLNLFRVNFRLNISLCVLAVIAYVFMTGLGASVVRAALMLLFVLGGKLIDRDAHSIALLSFVAFLMLIYNPMYINDVGFQLSFIVTFGLLIMTPNLIKSKNRFVSWIIATVSIPVIAQLWVIPIQIFYFNNISVYSVFANIMSVPILSVISFGGFLSSLFSLITPIAEFICHLFDIILNPLLQLLVWISDFWGSLPNASYQTTHPNVFQIILYYSVLLNVIWLFDETVRSRYRFIKPVLIVCILLFFCTFISIPDKNFEITAFDVGNADAFLIKTPENKYIMIDTGKSGFNGGKSQAEMIILKYFKDKGIKNADSVIVTHFDNDHCGGTADIIREMKVDKIYVNSLKHDSKSAREIYSAARKHGTKVIEAENNQVVYEKHGIKITNYISKDVAGIGDNESSVISLLASKDFSMLFMGDAGIETFNRLKSYIPSNITVLKVGHHGASGVVDKNMADYLNPKYSVISTGENKFGHPSAYTLEVLKKSNIIRTDKNNAVKFVIGKNNFKILNYDPQKRKFLKIK